MINSITSINGLPVSVSFNEVTKEIAFYVWDPIKDERLLFFTGQLQSEPDPQTYVLRNFDRIREEALSFLESYCIEWIVEREAKEIWLIGSIIKLKEIPNE